MEYFITAVALAAFGYFIYTRVLASRNKDRSGTGSGSGGGRRDDRETHQK